MKKVTSVTLEVKLRKLTQLPPNSLLGHSPLEPGHHIAGKMSSRMEGPHGGFQPQPHVGPRQQSVSATGHVSALQMILPSAFQSTHLMSSRKETKCPYHTLTPPLPNCKSVSKINTIMKPQEWFVLQQLEYLSSVLILFHLLSTVEVTFIRKAITI